jgi:hypothetical protein
MMSRLSPCYLTCSEYLLWVAIPGNVYDLSDADFRCGEEIAQAPGLVSLCPNETMVSFEMPRIVQSGGKRFVFLCIAFETHCFCLEGQIEAATDMVGFVVEVQGGRFFSAFRGFAG